MSVEEEAGPRPDPDSAPEPPPVAAPAYEGRPPDVMGGAFLIGCGACLVYAGGLCAGLMWAGSRWLDRAFTMAIGVAGIVAIVQGFRIARGRKRVGFRRGTRG